MRKETRNAKKETRERTTDAQQQEKQNPILKVDIAAFCVGLISVIYHHFAEDMEKQQGKAINTMSSSIFRGLGELIWLIEIQEVFLEYLLATWDHETAKKDLRRCLLMKDSVARDLVIQLHRRRLYMLNTRRVMEVE
jgi:hypothetical protein